MTEFSLLLDASTLNQHLHEPDLLIIDLSSYERYLAGHIPGAIHMEPARLQRGFGPIPNKLPTAEQLSALFSELGLTPRRKVVAYDDQMGALAGRLIWTLDIVGHRLSSVLDGQLEVWTAAGFALQTHPNPPQTSQFSAQIDSTLIADKAYLLNHLHSTDIAIWDARSEEEFLGDRVINAKKGGHIPGAHHFEWTQSLISPVDWRLQPANRLLQQLAARGISPDKEVITHCQTHRRSGLTYLVAKALGYPRIRCYDGSWFEWGNDPDTPVETD